MNNKRITVSSALLATVSFLLPASGQTLTPPGSAGYASLPYHTTLSGSTNSGSSNSVTPVPFWQAADSGYTYQMVGANPMLSGSNSTTSIPANVIPVIVTFSDGSSLDASNPNACSTAGSAQSLVLSSPLLNNTTYSAGSINEGSTQYLDFFQRSNFWQSTGPSGLNPNYHILLTALPGTALRITVPAASGRSISAPCGRLGEMDINWFDNYLTTSVIPQLAGAGVNPGTLPVFVLYNTVMYNSTVSNCCILGYHSASNNPSYSNQVQTYAVADFETTGYFGATHDVSSLSHEIGEWMNDPMGTNPTPTWGHTGQVSGCQNNLEVGDPLSGTVVTVTMPNAYSYHVQELAFKSWFYRDAPSSGVNGWYSSNGTFTTPSTSCDTSTTSLTISPASIAAGSTATASVRVLAGSGYSGTPTGQVSLISSVNQASLGTLTLSGGSASGAIAFPAGSYSVTAQYAGDANFAASASSPVAITVGSPSISLNPVALTFPAQTTGAAGAPQTITVSNHGTAALTVSSISVSGANAADFTQSNNCGSTVAAGSSCAVSVTFKPSAAGSRVATLSIADNVTGSPQTAPLSGTGNAVASNATVTFVKADTSTQGNWRSVYGTDGYNVIGDLASNPSYAAPVPSGQSGWTWAASTSDVRGLQKQSNPSDRIASTWYTNTSFTIDLNTTDQLPHTVALYCLDWDRLSRTQTVAVLDINGNVLNTQSVSNFSGGVYLVWTITGHVVLQITNSGSNAVISGLFFGSPSASSGTATATFVKTDITTQGSWRSVYGADGYNVIGDQASNPSYADPVPSGQSSWTWNASTPDVRALQKASNPSDRIASTWYTSSTPFTIDLNTTDQLTHQVALYCLDWDSNARVETVDVLDVNGNVLNTQHISNFNAGVYLVWNISGHVILRITNAGTNAVISGLFFGGPVVPPPAATATFVKMDATTQGSWKGVYGADGYELWGDVSLNPSYAVPTFPGASGYIWNASTSDVRALQKASNPSDRIAATWFSPTNFQIALNTTDTLPHQVALYCLDWDSSVRAQTISALDGSGNVLNSQTLTGNFNGGVYLVWNVTGPVTFLVTNNGTNAVVSGVFFK